MVHSSKTINRNFLIKASGINSEGKRINTLVGVSGLLALIGEDLADKFVTRAIKASFNNDSCCCKLRRGLRITFYNKKRRFRHGNKDERRKRVQRLRRRK